MGIDAHGAAWLLDRARAGAKFDRTLMIGRQNFFVGRREWRRVLARARRPVPPAWSALDGFHGTYAETFFKALGADTVNSMDATAYEGADRVHDLNQPVPPDWRETYDTVFDGGSLEHVFQFPTALLNCLQLVKPGGHFMAYTPANNYYGHGFYQFSPELWWRALGEGAGFKIEKMVAVEFGWRLRMFAVADPAAIGERISLINRAPVLLFVCARKTGPTPECFGPVLQSDYSATWRKGDASGAAAASAREGWQRRLLETFPGFTRRLERLHFIWFEPRLTFRNRAAFTPCRPDY
jgi:SAM-dependent methyltransferase